MKVVVVSLVAGLFTLPAALSQDVDDKDLAALQGTWKVQSIRIGGVDVPADKLEGVRAFVEKDRIAFKDGARVIQEFRFKLGAAQAPAHIDLTRIQDGAEKDVVKGIYKVEKNEFHLCSNDDPEGARPKDFKSAPGTKVGLGVMVRQPK